LITLSATIIFMQIGISLSVEEFGKEAIILDDLVDFFELHLTGRDDISGLLESEHKLLAHLAELDRMCFGSLELVKCLGVDKAVVHFYTRCEIAFDEKIAILDRLHKKAVEDGITLCLENTEESVNILKKVFARTPRLEFCLDVGHANLFSNNPLDFVEVFSDRLAYIHISDSRGGDSEEDDLHLPPGDGAIDFQRIFSELKAMNYDETLTLELCPFSDINVKVEGLRLLRKTGTVPSRGSK